MIYSKNPQSVLTVAVLSGGIAGLTHSVPAAGVGLSLNPAVDFADQQQVGSSTLARNPAGLTMTLETSGVASGHALTVWWVVFNNPQECATAPCSAEDLTNPAVQADVLGAADGAVVGEKRAEGAREEDYDNGESEITYFASHLNVADCELKATCTPIERDFTPDLHRIAPPGTVLHARFVRQGARSLFLSVGGSAMLGHFTPHHQRRGREQTRRIHL